MITYRWLVRSIVKTTAIVIVAEVTVMFRTRDRFTRLIHQLFTVAKASPWQLLAVPPNRSDHREVPRVVPHECPLSFAPLPEFRYWHARIVLDMISICCHLCNTTNKGVVGIFIRRPKKITGTTSRLSIQSVGFPDIDKEFLLK